MSPFATCPSTDRPWRPVMQVTFAAAVLASLATAQLGTPLRVPQTTVPGVSSAEQPRIAGTGSRFHVVWQDFRDPEWAIYYRGGTIGMFGNLTLDSAADVRLSQAGVSTLVNANDPAIATDGGTTVYVTWRATDAEQRQERIMFARSTDQGLNWSAGVALSVDAPYVSRPVICADDFNRVYVAWTQHDPAHRTDRVFLRASVNKGANWPNPAAGVSNLLAVSDSVYQIDPQLVCARNFLGVAYVDNRNFLAGQVLFQSSSDAGASFSNEQAVSTSAHAGASQSTFEPRMALAVTPPTRKIMIVWTHDACCLRSNWSTDSGATWQASDALVSSCTCAGLGTPGCPPVPDTTNPTFVLGADLAVGPSGKIYALYGSMLGTGTATTYVNAHTTSWGTEQALSAPGATVADKGFFPTPRPDIQASGSYVFATWMQSSLGNEQAFDVAARWTTDGGVTWLPAGGAASVPGKPPATPGEAESRSAFPACLLAPPTAVVAWDDRLEWTPPDFNASGPIFPGTPVVPLGAPETYLNSVYLDVGMNP